MTDSQKKPFEMKEFLDIFCIRENECPANDHKQMLEKINDMTTRFGREFVIRKIALREQN